MSEIRVLFDCRMADWTGVGRYTRSLARALAARDDVELVQLLAADAEPVVPGAPIVRAHHHPFDPRAGHEFARLADQVSPHVIHCPHFPVPSPVRFPLVVNMHDLTPLVVPGVMPSAIRRLYYRRMVGHAVRVADVVLTLSRFTADEVARLLPGARGKLAVGGAGAEDFAAGECGPLPERVERFLIGRFTLPGQGSPAPYVLSMGSTRPHKDLPTLLRAFALLAVRRTDVVLLLVGPEQPEWLASEAAQALKWIRATYGENRAPSMSELAERIAFTGRVSDAELRTLYADARAFVFPSRYEGFGLPPLEAMALSTPVIAADAGPLPEVVGDAGLLVPAGDAEAFARELARVLADDVLRASLIERGEARAAALTWISAARHTADVYRDVIRAGHSATGGSSATGG